MPSSATFSFTWSIANNDSGTGKNPCNFTINGTARTGGLSGTYMINRGSGVSRCKTRLRRAAAA